ncbi:alpha/beta fold hydrolase [Sphingomonas morindae]|uniref:Alpha/beta hydrolase n=1 Tax=Sphingomonas morindae TaxID=1541170 RepID=A0ABY4X510_9SPHN|nr:alpha/beta hydrolase [Sphingomonas morindae]USI71941.1 alpha/beta hydrolase [Sphingomonas morindae]
MSATATLTDSRLDRRRYPEGFVFATWRAPDGWAHRRFAWPAPAPRGQLLVQTGRADFIEKYLETCGHFQARGWSIEGFDWRGQGGSGRIAPGAGADVRTSLVPLIDDLEAYVAAWRARTPGPHVLLAHSMGGHVALRLVAERGVRLDGLILVAPMLGLNLGRLPLWTARLIVAGARGAGLGARVARHDREAEPARQLRFTADRARYEDSGWWKQQRPDLALGPPSWSWLGAALAGCATLRRLPLERVEVPVLMLVPGRDRLVDPQASVRIAARLPDASLHLFPGARHELLREADADRLAALIAAEAFLDLRVAGR